MENKITTFKEQKEVGRLKLLLFNLDCAISETRRNNLEIYEKLNMLHTSDIPFDNGDDIPIKSPNDILDTLSNSIQTLEYLNKMSLFSCQHISEIV